MHFSSFILHLHVDDLLCAIFCVRCWHIFVCVCVWHTHSYKIYLKLQILVMLSRKCIWVKGGRDGEGSFLIYLRESGKAFLRIEHLDWDLKDQREASTWRLGEEQSKQKEQNGQRPEARRSLGYLRGTKRGPAWGRDCTYRSGPLGKGPELLRIPRMSPSELLGGSVSSLLDL